MIAALFILCLEGFLIWFIFFKKHWAKFGYGWGLVSVYGGLHVLLVFMVGMRLGQPYSTDARIVRNTVQIIPRLPQPTLLQEVLVEPNQMVKKGDPLFQFDRRLYEYEVKHAEAELARAIQQVGILKANVTATGEALAKAKAEQAYATTQRDRYKDLADKGAGRQEEYQRWQDQYEIAVASVRRAEAEHLETKLKYESQVDGENTIVVQARAALDEARYYLEQTTLVAPADGFITNLQAMPGMVAGSVRVGAIASFVMKEEPYLLGTYVQEHLKHVKPGQPVEIALDFYPGQILNGTVESVWWATGTGQYLPSGQLPEFPFLGAPKGRFAVKIRFDEPDSLNLPIGGQGAAAIYTDALQQYSILRRIEIRAHTALNYLFPLPI
jgi:multidrug resistance efflux pump